MEQPEVIEAWVRWEQKLLWYDFDESLRRALDGAWSMPASNLAIRICQAARLVGPTDYSEIPYKLVAGGVYEAVLRAGGVTPRLPADEVEWQRLDAMMAKYQSTRAVWIPKYAATVARIGSDVAWNQSEFDPANGAAYPESATVA